MPARGIHARKGLVEARRQCWHSESARPLGMPYDLGAVTEYHRGPRPGRRVNQRLADEHTGLALRLQAVGVRWKTACPVLRCFAPGVPENCRRAASCAGSAPSGGTIVPGPDAHAQVLGAVDEVALGRREGFCDPVAAQRHQLGRPRPACRAPEVLPVGACGGRRGAAWGWQGSANRKWPQPVLVRTVEVQHALVS